MNVLITGANGQLGRELQVAAPAWATVIAVDAEQLDITDAASVHDWVHEFVPELVINAAAYTAVDQAESEPVLAHLVNAAGVGHLAAVAQFVGARFIHVSTDFVFSGRKSSPYLPTDPAAPLSVYGASKLAGEHQAIALTGGQALVFRTAWLYSAGGKNFVNTMLRLMREREWLGIVADQIGTPTWARTLAEAIWVAAARPRLTGIYHWTDNGVASWYDFAMAIQEEALALDILTHPIPIRPICTKDYPTPARRPAYSVLNKSSSCHDLALAGRHWRGALRAMLSEE